MYSSHPYPNMMTCVCTVRQWRVFRSEERECLLPRIRSEVPVKSLMCDCPGSITGKAWCRLILSLPSCAHHTHSKEQGSVTGQVERKGIMTYLCVVAIHPIGILR